MSVIDIVLLGFLLLGLVRGFIRGFFVEVASLVALIAGIYGAIHFSYYVAELLMDRVDWNEKTVNITAFAITFIVIVMVIALAGKALTKLADFAALGILNKLLGALFGGLKMALILSVLLNIFEKLNTTITFLDKEHTEDAVLYKPVKSLVPLIFPFVIKSEDLKLEEEPETQKV
jgi:membrane protein required for colicin V production